MCWYTYLPEITASSLFLMRGQFDPEFSLIREDTFSEFLSNEVKENVRHNIYKCFPVIINGKYNKVDLKLLQLYKYLLIQNYLFLLVVENIYKNREPVRQMKALYFISPTSKVSILSL